jgi:hypothetical protein
MLLETVGLSSSSFYYRLKAGAAPDKYASLRKQIAATVKASQFTYGYRRIWWSLRHDGIRVSEKVVRRLMRQDQIVVHAPKSKRKWTSYQGEMSPVCDQLLAGRLSSKILPFQRRVSCQKSDKNPPTSPLFYCGVFIIDHLVIGGAGCRQKRRWAPSVLLYEFL